MNETSAPTTDCAIYLYCLARPECLSTLQDLRLAQDLFGVDKRYPVTTLEDGVEATSVVAVISEVDSAEFSEANLQDLSWLGPRAQRHEAIVGHVMTVSPLLPVKFGAIFSSRSKLKKFIHQHQVAIVSALDDLRDKAEWSVKGYLIESEALPMLLASDATLQSRLAALSSSPGARYIQQRQLDTATEAVLSTWLTQVTQDIHTALALHAANSSALRCHASTVTGRTERMVFNVSFLLADAAIADFRATITALQTAYHGSGLMLELRGPWPAYNFCPTLAEGGS